LEKSAWVQDDLVAARAVVTIWGWHAIRFDSVKEKLNSRNQRRSCIVSFTRGGHLRRGSGKSLCAVPHSYGQDKKEWKKLTKALDRVTPVASTLLRIW